MDINAAFGKRAAETWRQGVRASRAVREGMTESVRGRFDS